MSDAPPQAFQGTAPSDVLARYPELHNANTAAPPPPAPFKPLPWWRCLFRRWEEPEFIGLKSLTYSGHKYMASFYRQRHRRTGKRRYWAAGYWGREALDAAAYENGTLVFLGNMDYWIS
jgi:hypothetical protein